MEEIKVLTHGFVDAEFVAQIPNALVKFGSKAGFEVLAIAAEELRERSEIGGMQSLCLIEGQGRQNAAWK